MKDIKKKQKEREERKKAIRRKRWLKLLVIVFFALVIKLAYSTAVSSGFFDVRQIEVSGNSSITNEEIIEMSLIKKKASIFSFDLKNAENKITKSPWISKASIDKKLPSTIRITVSEEKPIIVLKNSDGYWLISAGHIPLELQKKKPKKLPIISIENEISAELGYKLKDKQVTSIINIFRAMSNDLGRRMTGASSIGKDIYFMLGNKEIQIIYGDSDEAEKKNLVVEKIIADSQNKEDSVYYIDVRVLTKPAIKRLPTQSEIRM